MSIMNKLLSFLLLVCLAATGLTAQVSVNGTVFIGSGPQTPLPDYPVVLDAQINGVDLTEVTQTDENGYYEFNLEDIPLNGVYLWSVGTFDPCTGLESFTSFELTPNQPVQTIDLVVCDGINPPPPPDTCVAFFDYEETGPLTFQFATLVADFIQIDSLLWDFGDGTTSDQLGPQHTYAENGAYPVILTVYSPNCVATYLDVVFAFDPADCECDDIYQPVCAFGPSGEIITFSNECEAACSGFPFNQLFDCSDEDCVCPTFYAPVCVIEPSTGDSLTFTNHCFAECEGYGPDQWIECYTVPDTFPCDFFPFPVCVIESNFPDSLVSFPTLCDALGAGYDIEELTDCGFNNCSVQVSFYAVSNDGLTFDFQATAPNGVPFDTYTWDFGDGTTSTEAAPSHTYSEYGDYVVTVTASTSNCSATSSVFVSAIEDNGNDYYCQAFFFFEQPDTTNLLTYQFVNFTFYDENSTSNFTWDFGDGTTSNELNPLHTFPAEGSYTVTLSINDSIGGCQSSIGIGINAGENVWYGDLECRAWFLPIIDGESNQVYFINWSSYDAVEFFWDFGDGTFSNEFEAQHEYADAGTYTATLTTTSSSGCVNTYSVTIDLAGGNFTSNPSFRLLSSIDEAGNVTLPLLEAFPNPTKDQVTVRWENGTSGNYNWSLFDVAGRELQSSKDRSTTASNSFNVNLSDQPAGLYFLKVRTPEGLQVLRLSKAE